MVAVRSMRGPSGGGRRESSSRLLPGTYQRMAARRRGAILCRWQGRPSDSRASPTPSRTWRPSEPMAKRVRGSSTRPGQRPRLQRAAAPRARVDSQPVTPAPSTSLTPAEEARAAELEAQIVAAEREAESMASRGRERGRRPEEGVARVRPGSIAVRGQEEYAYVSPRRPPARDDRRFADRAAHRRVGRHPGHEPHRVLTG